MGSLQVRLFLTYLVIIGVTLGLTALSLFLLLGGYREQISYGNLEDIGSVIDELAESSIENAVRRGEAEPRGGDLLGLLRNFLVARQAGSSTPPDTSVAVIGRDGRVLPGLYASSWTLENAAVDGLSLPLTSESGDGRPQRCHIKPTEGGNLLCVSTPLSQKVLDAFPGTDAAAIIVAEPAAGVGEVLGDLAPRLVSAGLIGVAAALVLGFLLSQSVAAPLRNIAIGARNVARGNYGQRVAATGPREVRDLAANFNRMTEEVQRSQQTLRDFLMNISHELKTPLTSIRGFSQAVLDGTIDDKQGIDRSAKIINGEASRVLRLVEELLDLSRIESRQVTMRQDDVDVKELFGYVAEVFALRAEENGVRVEVEPNSTGRVRGDFDRLEQVFNNLLDNALRHTPAGGTVKLNARDVQQGFIQVTVSDTGPGIPAGDLPHLFERFYRGNEGGGGKGYGLGLAITREIVRSHGGDIWATSDPGRGTAFVFTLPSTAQRLPAAGKRKRRRRGARPTPQGSTGQT